MSTLILTLDDDLMAQAEAYARRNGVDLAALITSMLRPVVAGETSAAKPVPPELARLYGCISLPADYDYKTHLDEVFNDQGNR